MDDWRTHPKSIEYYRTLRGKRINESTQMLTVARISGVTDDTDVFQDFRFYSPFEHELLALRDKILDDYTVELTRHETIGMWILDCTTRPDSGKRTTTELLSWVDDMLEIAESCGCIFSRWTLTIADTGQEFSTFTFST